MPKKFVFETDLVDIKITRKCHTYLLSLKQRGHPMYSLIDKIVGAYKDNEEARTWEEMYQSQIAATQHWMKKATDMEKKLREILSNGMQSTLDVKA